MSILMSHGSCEQRLLLLRQNERVLSGGDKRCPILHEHAFSGISMHQISHIVSLDHASRLSLQISQLTLIFRQIAAVPIHINYIARIIAILLKAI